MYNFLIGVCSADLDSQSEFQSIRNEIWEAIFI